MRGDLIHEGFVPGRFPIDAYGNGGFRFADMSHRGSVLALPSGIRAWPVASPRDISEEVLAPVFEERDSIELLLLGTGLDVEFVSPFLRQALREAGIGLEVMQTGAAARTYNILIAENRKAAAALVAVD
jgi:uncharacterized protein